MCCLYCAIFQSTPPVKAATDATIKDGGTSVFQSTPPVKAATFSTVGVSAIAAISIHAAREGGDARKHNRECNPAISIHAAREGGDRNASRMNAAAPDFNPRRP